MRLTKLAALPVLLALAAAACGPAPTPPDDSQAVATPEAGAGAGAGDAGTSGTGASGQPTDTLQGASAAQAGQLAPLLSGIGELETKLAAAGVEMEKMGGLAADYFEVTGTVYALAEGRDNLEVRVYPNPGAAVQAASRVLPDGLGVYDQTGELIAIQWNANPHFYLNGPLLVIYVGSEPSVQDALERVVGPQFAGAPRGNQP